MITLSERSMHPFKIEFVELFQRHLCRHSHFGVNVIHLITLLGIWCSFAGILYGVLPLPVLMTLGTLVFTLVAVNTPNRLMLQVGCLALIMLILISN